MKLNFLNTIPVIFLLLSLPLALASNQTRKVCIKNVCIQAEIADDDISRQKGLMFRDALGDNQGMLFIFTEQGRYNFWMRNMKFSLDIIWIDEEKKIVEIRKNVPPCGNSCRALIPRQKARYALEVNPGFVEKNKIRLGDKVSF